MRGKPSEAQCTGATYRSQSVELRKHRRAPNAPVGSGVGMATQACISSTHTPLEGKHARRPTDGPVPRRRLPAADQCQSAAARQFRITISLKSESPGPSLNNRTRLPSTSNPAEKFKSSHSFRRRTLHRTRIPRDSASEWQPRRAFLQLVFP
jgi:hypothetical protein